MKRGKPLARKTRLTAKKPLKRGTKRLPKVNVRQEAKRKAKRQAWYRSPEYRRRRKESMERAGGRCEYVVEVAGIGFRCEETERLQMHERAYGDKGADPAKRQMLCKVHHELVEMLDHPSRRRNAR